ncbi:hypothetical protein IT407_02970 [Candidatus Uhrbacteria bacterium]|nr:hypothetical protein [Candidatus Uhrbacteria bacterium]
MIKGILKKIYYRVRASTPVWNALNAKSRKEFISFESSLTGVSRRIADDLTHDGIAISNLEELGAPSLEAFRRFVAERSAMAASTTKKTFLRELIDLRPLYNPSEPIWGFALHPSVVGAVDLYFGLVARFYYLYAAVAGVMPDGEEAKQSQRWHRDPEDRQMCKVFVYLTDVDAGSGPFIYAKESHRMGAYSHVSPQKPPAGSYPPEGLVEASIPAEKIMTCYGKAGTVIFADTAGLHRGGYCTERERIMVTAGYVSDASPWPTRYALPPGFDPSSVEPPVRAALASRKRSWDSAGY